MLRRGPLSNAHPSPGNKVTGAGFQPARIRCWAKTEGQSRKCKEILNEIRKKLSLRIDSLNAQPRKEAPGRMTFCETHRTRAFVKYSLQKQHLQCQADKTDQGRCRYDLAV
jgi:hypothetical protein